MKPPPIFTDSCSHIMEKPIEGHCDNDSLDSKSGEQDSENKPEAKQGLTQKNWVKFDELLNKHILNNDLDNVLGKKDVGLPLEKKINDDDDIIDHPLLSAKSNVGSDCIEHRQSAK